MDGIQRVHRVALLSNADNTLVRVAAMIQNEKNQSTERSLAMTDKTNMLVMSQFKQRKISKWG